MLLLLDGAIDDRKRGISGRRDKRRVGPQRGQRALQQGNLLSKQPRAIPLGQLHQARDAHGGLTLTVPVDFIDHDFQFLDPGLMFLTFLSNDLLQPIRKRRRPHLSPILGAPDNMKMIRGYTFRLLWSGVSIEPVYRLELSLVKNARSTESYPLLRVEIPKIKIERLRDFPPRLIRPLGMEPLDLEKDSHISALVAIKGDGLTKFAS
jgi:hypothetical protein